jgi:hypothetical protein
MSAQTESYSQEAVQQILQLALAGQTETPEFTRSQLLEMASELGISTDQLQLAEAKWQERQSVLQEQEEFDQFRRKQLVQHSAKYSITNIFLLLLDFTEDGKIHWSLGVLLIWGMILALDAWQTFQRQSQDYDRKFQQWRRRKLLKQSVSSLLSQVVDRLKG